MNRNWNLSGLILEGTCGSGKTSIFQAVLQSSRFVRRTFPSAVVLSEHQTQRVLEQKEREEGLAKEDNISLLESHVSYLERTYDRLRNMQWCDGTQTDMRIGFVFERFHLTHVCHYSHMSWNDVEGIDARLAGLGGKLCLLTVDPSLLEERITTNRSDVFLNYLKRFGATNAEIAEHFAAEQRLYVELCGRSTLETRIIETSTSSIEESLGEILDFWGVL
jgi:hypothetical protein